MERRLAAILAADVVDLIAPGVISEVKHGAEMTEEVRVPSGADHQCPGRADRPAGGASTRAEYSATTSGECLVGSDGPACGDADPGIQAIGQ